MSVYTSLLGEPWRTLVVLGMQTVEAPTLSLLVPLLVRGLAERATAIRRKTAVIIDNMAKLVDSPHDAAVFLPRLLPGLKNMSAQVHTLALSSPNLSPSERLQSRPLHVVLMTLLCIRMSRFRTSDRSASGFYIDYYMHGPVLPVDTLLSRPRLVAVHHLVSASTVLNRWTHCCADLGPRGAWRGGACLQDPAAHWC